MKTRCRLAARLLLGALFCVRPAAAALSVPSEYPTIQDALDVAAPGDTVVVAPGTYSDKQTRLVDLYGRGFLTTVTAVAFVPDGVTLLSEGGSGVTTLDYGGQTVTGSEYIAVAELSTQTVTVDGFRFTGTPPFHGRGLYLAPGAPAKVANCWFDAITNNGFLDYGGAILSATDVSVVDCEFNDCRGYLGSVIHTWVGFTMDRCRVVNCQNAVLADLANPSTSAVDIRDSEFIATYGQQGAVEIYGQYLLVQVSRCRFVDCTTNMGGGGLYVGGQFGSPAALLDNLFLRCVAAYGGGAYVRTKSTIRGNTFVDCTVTSVLPPTAAALNVSTVYGLVPIEQNLFVGSTGGVAYAGNGLCVPACNVYWSNADGESNLPLAASDRIVNPLFCAPDLEDFTLDSASPCLPSNSGGCGQVGALGQGCGPVSVESLSWGRLKNRYR